MSTLDDRLRFRLSLLSLTGHTVPSLIERQYTFRLDVICCFNFYGILGMAGFYGPEVGKSYCPTRYTSFDSIASTLVVGALAPAAKSKRTYVMVCQLISTRLIPAHTYVLTQVRSFVRCAFLKPCHTGPYPPNQRRSCQHHPS